MEVNYGEQTYNSKNLFARYSHKIRFRYSIRQILENLPINGYLLDYGCGDGYLIKKLRKYKLNSYGYDPFSKATKNQSLEKFIYRDILKIPTNRKYDLITIYETVEHLDIQEFMDFLEFCKFNLKRNGKILVSVPIMIGPALILKELRRLNLFKKSDYGLMDLLFASIFGISPCRSINIKTSHKGYDFRETFKFIRSNYGKVVDIQYSPFKIGTWYGNSQVFFSIVLNEFKD